MPDHVEDMKAGRVVVSDPRAGGSCIWYYEDGLLKNQVLIQGLGQGHPGPRHLWVHAEESDPNRNTEGRTQKPGPWGGESADCAPWASHALLWASVCKNKSNELGASKGPPSSDAYDRT